MLDRRRRLLSRLAGRDAGAHPTSSPGTRSASTRALVVAGALTLAEALPLVRFRAEAMQEAVPVGVGAMAAILGLDAAAVRAGCDAAQRGHRRGRVQAANFNDPKPDRDRRQQGGGRQGLRAAQGGRREAGAAAAGLGAVPLAADEAGGRAAARAAGDACDRCAVHPGDRQRRRAQRDRAGGDPRRALSPGLRAGALGRDDPGDPRPRRRPRSSNADRARCSPAWSSGSTPARSRPRSSTRRRWRRRGRCSDERRQPARGRQVALVTGASRGIGRAIARDAGAEGLSGRRHRDHRGRRRGHRRGAGRLPGLPRHRPRRHRRRRRRRGGRRAGEGGAAACTCWSTTPASPATCCRCA